MGNRAGAGMGRFQVGVLVALPLILTSEKNARFRGSDGPL
ncbi:hypothetical protein EDC35_101168 [Thiobaca trueperi]|uniref:Uncharacterized protein n=1 Tax=Thiobaca trueperi TaxID=127458 RepID=A0A4R3N502_9GAMM|nr:hypothetical protein EDC35_101168 [Thiobaca trueperi]